MDEKNMELARNWVAQELAYCILNGWSVEFHSLNGGLILRFRFQNVEKMPIKSFRFRLPSNST